MNKKRTVNYENKKDKIENIDTVEGKYAVAIFEKNENKKYKIDKEDNS